MTAGARRFVRARARVGRKPGMNKTEAAYAERLELLRAAREIVEWRYEELTLKLGVDTRYTPDFLVQLASGELELHEVKGRNSRTGSYYAKDDALVKFRIAARQFPLFTFRLLWPDGAGGWQEKEIAP